MDDKYRPAHKIIAVRGALWAGDKQALCISLQKSLADLNQAWDQKTLGEAVAALFIYQPERSMFLLTEAAATALLSPSERRELRFKKGISSAPGDEHFDLSRLPRPTKGSSPTLARSVSGASAAAAVPATASPSGADRSGSVTVRVLFRRAGALGLDFTIDGNQSVVVDRIAPGSVAAAEPRLSEGLRLVEVQGRRTHHMEAKDALDILKRYAADRPLALAFAAE